MDQATRARTVLQPGPWLRLKRYVPARLHPLLDPVEGLLYDTRGVPFNLAGHAMHVLRQCPVPVSSAYRAPSPETVDDLVFMSVVLESLRPGDLFLDAGSHYGLYAIGAATLVGPSGRVVAFEPTPESAALVRSNVALNSLSARVEVQEAAVTDRVGTVEFTASGSSCQNAIATYDPFRGSGAARPRSLVVRTVALDDYVDPARRTVVKIDVEGAEILALRGAPKLLTSSARIFVELHAWGWSSEREGWEEIQDLARRAGRTIVGLDGAPIDRPSHQRVELARSTASA